MEKFKALLSKINVRLKPKGYSKNGTTFYLFEDSNWGLINFQKSKSSSPETTLFTINVGTVSTKLRNILEQVEVKTKPSIEDCHWKSRIGHLMPMHKDQWWEISNDTSIEDLSKDIINLIETYITPQIEKYIHNDSLMQSWLNNKHEGITELQQFVFLTTMLQHLNDDRLSNIIYEFQKYAKGKSYELSVIEHLKELEKHGK